MAQSFVLLLLFHDILSDLPIELANIIVDLVQVFLDQQLNIRVFHVGQVSVLRPVHAPIEIPAGWQVLVEEFVLNRGNLLIRHIFAFLEQFGLSLLGSAQFQQVFDNRDARLVEISPVSQDDSVLVSDPLALVPHPTEGHIVSRDDHLEVLSIVLLIDDNASQSLEHHSRLGRVRRRPTCL